MDGPSTTERKQVFLHVGSPKTGTTFLQHLLWSNRQLVQDQGLLLPLQSNFDHFLASLDLRGLSSRPQHPARAVGIWDKAVAEGLAWDGNVLISHELFAGATTEQAERAVTSWGDVDVRVIVTARDLGRQIPAEWQEHLKHRADFTFMRFVDELRDQGPSSRWFWSVQDFADVCRRWGAALPAASVHLVTVPPRGAAPEALWRRFAGVLGLDVEQFEIKSSRANLSLNAEQAELLRRVNQRLGERVRGPGRYPATVKEVFAQDVLAGRPGMPVALTAENRDFVLARAGRMIEELRELQVDVVGDLDDLIPEDAPPSSDGVIEHPELLPDDVLLSEAEEALAGLLDRYNLAQIRSTEANKADIEAAAKAQREVARLRDELENATFELDELRVRYDKLIHDMRYRPGKQLIIGLTERWPLLMRLRVGYWWLVNRARALRSHA